MGHLQDGTGPFFGVDASVGGSAFDGDREAAGGFPGRLQLSRPAEGRFQDEGPNRAASEPTNERGGVGAADLLVGVDHDHAVGRGPQAEVFHGPERVEHLHQAALHVKDARPAEGFALDANRHLCAPCRPARRCRSGRRATATATFVRLSRAGEQRACRHTTREEANGHPGLLQLGR